MNNYSRDTKDFDVIVDAFNELKRTNGKNVKAKEAIEKTIGLLFGMRRLDFRIDISAKPGMNFYGMSVSPSANELERAVQFMLSKKNRKEVEVYWSKINEWDISIDMAIFTDKKLNFNGSEMTAMLLHEIGHVVFSNTAPMMFRDRLVKTLKSQNRLFNALVEPLKITKHTPLSVAAPIIFLVPSLLLTCNNTILKYVEVDNLDEEVEADAFVVKCGFGKHLNSAINKIIVVYGNSSIHKSDATVGREIEASLNEAIGDIARLEYRKGKLFDDLKAKAKATQHPSIKRAYYHIADRIFNLSHAPVTESFVPGFVEREPFDIILESVYARKAEKEFIEINKRFMERAEATVVAESILDRFGVKKLEKVYLSEIQQIEIEISGIRNNDDRSYMLDLCYYQKSLIELGLDAYENESKKIKPQNSKAELLRLNEHLDRLIKTIMGMKIPEEQYGLFIRYPVGYEG